jgi:hypothetical protein
MVRPSFEVQLPGFIHMAFLISDSKYPLCELLERKWTGFNFHVEPSWFQVFVNQLLFVFIFRPELKELLSFALSHVSYCKYKSNLFLHDHLIESIHCVVLRTLSCYEPLIFSHLRLYKFLYQRHSLHVRN